MEKEKIIEKVELSINQLVDEFVANPYLHRVEHSLHAHLYHIMKQHLELSQIVEMKNGYKTQLIHKEYPETNASKAPRRGSFDMAILNPKDISDCDNLDKFKKGHIEPFIVIEMGLNYPEGYQRKHFSKDIKKMQQSKVQHGYIIHFLSKKQDIFAEKIIKTRMIDGKKIDDNIKIIYVAFNNNTFIKL